MLLIKHHPPRNIPSFSKILLVEMEILEISDFTVFQGSTDVQPPKLPCNGTIQLRVPYPRQRSRLHDPQPQSRHFQHVSRPCHLTPTHFGVSVITPGKPISIFRPIYWGNNINMHNSIKQIKWVLCPLPGCNLVQCEGWFSLVSLAA